MKLRAFTYVILAGVLWGTSGIFVHYLSPYGFTSLQLTAVRGTVSALVMVGYALIRDRRLFRIGWRELLLFSLIGASLFGTASLYFTAMQMTSVSTAVVLMYTAPVYVSIFSMLFFGERFTPLKLISIAVMLLGCGLVSGIIGGMRFDGPGILVGVLCGAVYATYNILTKIAMRRGSHPVSTTAYSFIFLSLIAVAVCRPDELFQSAASAPEVTLPLRLGLGLLTFVAPYFLYTLGMKELPAGTVSALGIVEPMSATLFSVLLLGERLEWTAVVGIVLILIALVALGKSDGKEK